MNKYKVRFVVEHEIQLETESPERAVSSVCSYLQRTYTHQPARLLGVIPADQQWPDNEPTKRPPPRSTPPSGSPNTPSIERQPELAQAVAA